MSNYTGITPLLNRILIKPMVVVNQTASGIIVSTEGMSEREQLGNTTGEIIEIGPDAFKDEGYSEPPVKPGDKVIMAKYAGLMYVGKDGNKYRMINHSDLTGLLDPDMDLVDPHLSKGIK